MISITLFNADNKIFINCDKEGTIYADKTPEETIKTIEGTYNNMHGRSYESSMSACIYYMFFNPRVVTVKDIDVSGHAYGITCRPEALKYWEEAAQPRLISQNGN
jgi:hypothetical protein